MDENFKVIGWVIFSLILIGVLVDSFFKLDIEDPEELYCKNDLNGTWITANIVQCDGYSKQTEKAYGYCKTDKGIYGIAPLGGEWYEVCK